MPRGGGIDGWVAPVTPLFGAPAHAARPPAGGRGTTDDEGWYVPSDSDRPLTTEEGASAPDEDLLISGDAESSRPTDESVPSRTAAVPRRLPTFADFERPTKTGRGDARGVLHAAERFGGRRDSGAGREAVAPAETSPETPRRRIENVSTAALARRGLSESEVRSRLMEKGFTSEQVEPEIQRLLSAGYLDDRRLAEEVVRVEAERKGKGRSAIVAELRRRGIDPDDFADAVAELDADDELERARDLVNRKLSSLRNVDDETAKRRLSGALARRGFGGDVVRAAVDQGMTDRP